MSSEAVINFMLKGLKNGLEKAEKKMDDYGIKLFRYEKNEKLKEIEINWRKIN
jgi:hypothetical protein